MYNLSVNFTTAERFNQITFYLRIPALVFLCIVLPIGIFGNACVIYIYGFRLKKSNVFFFITLLACSDITSCLFVIPLEMYRIHNYYAYPLDATCRLQSYVLFASYINSTLLLLIISIERYIKVCQSATRQMRAKLAKRLGMITIILAMLLALPSASWDSRKKYITEHHILCYKCSPYIDQKLWSYAISIFSFSFLIWVTMLALYSLLLKTIKNQEAWNLHERNEFRLESDSATRMQTAKRLSRTNRTVLCLSLVYICTCSFYSSFVLVSRLVSKIHEEDNIHYFIFILNESWVINIIFNPIVYGFFNTRFRIEIYKILGLCFKNKEFRTGTVIEHRDSNSVRSF